MSDTQHTTLTDVAGLPPEARASRYREVAERHLELGRTSTVPEARAAHLELAALWMRLSSEAERQARGYGITPEMTLEGGAAEPRA